MIRYLKKLFLFLYKPNASTESFELALAVPCSAAIIRRFTRAEAGEADYQFRVGQIYYHDFFQVGQDIHRAIFWYQKAAEQGHEKAKKQLFLLRVFGKEK